MAAGGAGNAQCSAIDVPLVRTFAAGGTLPCVWACFLRHELEGSICHTESETTRNDDERYTNAKLTWAVRSVTNPPAAKRPHCRMGVAATSSAGEATPDR